MIVAGLSLVCRWFIKVRESIRMLFTSQGNLNDTGSPLFISRNGTNCLIACDS